MHTIIRSTIYFNKEIISFQHHHFYLCWAYCSVKMRSFSLCSLHAFYFCDMGYPSRYWETRHSIFLSNWFFYHLITSTTWLTFNHFIIWRTLIDLCCRYFWPQVTLKLNQTVKEHFVAITGVYYWVLHILLMNIKYVALSDNTCIKPSTSQTDWIFMICLSSSPETRLWQIVGVTEVSLLYDMKFLNLNCRSKCFLAWNIAAVTFKLVSSESSATLSLLSHVEERRWGVLGLVLCWGEGEEIAQPLLSVFMLTPTGIY